MEEPKAELLKQLRAVIDIKGKAKSKVVGLSDGDLWQVYAAMRAGAQNTEIAQDLIKRGLIDGSVDAFRKIVAKTRRRWLPFLCTPSPVKPPKAIIPPVDYNPDAKIEGMSEVQDLDILAQRYRAILDRELTECEAGGALSQVLSRHVTALTGLIKAKDKLRSDCLKAKRPSWSPEQGPDTQAAFDDIVEKFSDGGRVMREACRRFLKFAGDYCVTLEDGVPRKVIH